MDWIDNGQTIWNEGVIGYIISRVFLGNHILFSLLKNEQSFKYELYCSAYNSWQIRIKLAFDWK